MPAAQKIAEQEFTDLFFFIALFTEIFAATSHFCATHSVLFSCKVFLLLCLCDMIY